MLSEHNPIAELIHQIQKKWTDEVSPFPDLKLVRWLIKPEEARLYEGFLKLESTEHGAIPEVLVAMLTPFGNADTYSKSLINDWQQAYANDKKTQEKLNAKGVRSNWEPLTFSTRSSDTNQATHFLKMLSSFQKEMVGAGLRLVVALLPHSIHSIEGYKWWLITMLKSEIPREITFMIFDHVGEFYFDKIFEKYPEITQTLRLNLDLDGAISKIAKMGNPNSPEVKLRECILEMGQSLRNNNLPRLHQWGEKALQVTQRSGVKSTYASAHIIYAGMLFSLKQFDKIDSLLHKGLSIAQQGLKAEGAACLPLIIQFHGYIASSKHLQKKTTEAITAYEKQGDLATEHKMPGMALMPYQQAYMLSKRHLPRRYEELIQKAFSAGKSMQREEQLNSSFATVALDFMQWQKASQQWEEAKRTEDEMAQLFGADWKQKAKNPGAGYTADVAAKEPVPIN